ncbi:ornithine cyclodeaminase [Amycolatopsis sp. NPDC059090]|uniref:ornithine cyclodeaminase n=1 Tax=unclassified Amycolatopsis TaxID=2618356 RepID=UPI00366FC0B3
MTADDHPGDRSLRYLPRADVIAACEHVDEVAVLRRALSLHAVGRSILPAEAYLGWSTSDGRPARSLALPGALWDDDPAIGVKIINSSLGNADLGIARAQGLTLLFDRETARPAALMEAAYISALRTAAYTALSADLLAARVETVAVIGCGTLGETHALLLSERLPSAGFLLHDLDPDRCARLAGRLRERGARAGCVPDAEAAVRPADVVVTTTTVTSGYLEYAWLREGALIAHVSLDDVLPEVVERADLLVVDDWELVRSDTRRVLGRMHQAGLVVGPAAEAAAPDACRKVDAVLGSVLTGRHPGRTDDRQIVLSNPFGMGILDVAIAAEVWKTARALGLGIELPV